MLPFLTDLNTVGDLEFGKKKERKILKKEKDKKKRIKKEIKITSNTYKVESSKTRQRRTTTELTQPMFALQLQLEQIIQKQL